ncbi:MAG: type II toxin-antitoxin system PemK/MazF family toxin [Bacteroidota bacterium]
MACLNPFTGTEPGKARPVIIVQSDLLNGHHPSSVICPLTTDVKKEIEILRVHLEKDCCGLPEVCDIMVDQTRAIDNRRLMKRLGLAPASIISTL